MNTSKYTLMNKSIFNLIVYDLSMKIFLQASCFILINLIIGSDVFAQSEHKEKALVIAHRGASAYAPENTMASAELGWKLGADAVEIDVHLTSDKEIVVIHDHTTTRTSGKNFIVKETSLSTLKNLDVGSWKDAIYKGEPIPTLSEIMELIPEEKKLVVEIKGEISLVPVMKKELAGHKKLDQLIFIAFDYETITSVKEAFPDNKAYWLSSKFSDDMKAILEKVRQDGLDGVDLHHSLIAPELMNIAQELQLEVHCWTVNDPEIAAKLNRLGVNSITTDIPDKILTVVQK